MKRSKNRISKHNKTIKRGGGCSTGYRMNFGDILGDKFPSLEKYETCQSGGKKYRSRSINRKRLNKPKARKTKKIDKKKLDTIINKLCASLKRKCTPKYKRLLKKIVINNM
jgi:hypothetical protein